MIVIMVKEQKLWNLKMMKNQIYKNLIKNIINNIIHFMIFYKI